MIVPLFSRLIFVPSAAIPIEYLSLPLSDIPTFIVLVFKPLPPLPVNSIPTFCNPALVLIFVLFVLFKSIGALFVTFTEPLPYKTTLLAPETETGVLFVTVAVPAPSVRA